MPQLSPHSLLMLILPLYVTLLLLYVGQTSKTMHIQKSKNSTKPLTVVVYKLLYKYLWWQMYA